MEFRLLGPPEVRGVAGREWFRGHRQRAVFATLALSANRVVVVDRLVDVVWSDRPPPTAQAQIQKTVSALRQLLDSPAAGGERINTVSSGYMLYAEPGEIDVGLFEQGVQQASSAVAAGNLLEATTCFRGALARWFGRAIDGVPGLVAEATHLEEQRLVALEKCAHIELMLGRHAEVATELERLVTAHPLRERLRVLQMIALYGCGRRAEALQVFHNARLLLKEDLGIDPGPQLRDVEHAILTEVPVAQVLPAPC
ncbi:AfsR/SARP family transcriptional regulator [Streptosporangium sp. CA-115845]|uniref:AfsR/SARP family transcriptional regulator n=1 Tax=Streptosporangium sp. CA-115845 TaxID=3240071 RepID=UPI003D8AC1B4